MERRNIQSSKSKEKTNIGGTVKGRMDSSAFFNAGSRNSGHFIEKHVVFSCTEPIDFSQVSQHFFSKHYSQIVMTELCSVANCYFLIPNY